MHLRFITVLAIAVASVSAIAYPEAVPAIERRQAPGTPQYDCHANCGGIITIARAANYCQSSNFTTALTACLNCALQYDIWKYYSSGVTAAASGCGLAAVPVNSTANSTTAANVTSSASSAIRSSTSGASSTSSGATAAATSAGAAMRNILDIGAVAVVVGVLMQVVA